MAKKAIRPIRVEGNVAYVPLTKGYETVIDFSDVNLVEGFNWCAHEVRKKGSVCKVYAVRTALHSGRNVTVLMHRVVLQAGREFEVDHRDSDGLNNRRSNLRIATPSENRKNQVIGSRNTSGVKGVSWHRKAQKWLVQIHSEGKRTYLGLFADIDAAAAAYASASERIHGEFGRLS